MADNPFVTYFALYRADEAGPVNEDEGVCAICVGLFTDYDEALMLAREHLEEGYSISIDVGMMTTAEWDAIDEVPDDFSPPTVISR
jgi:tRNA U54 and U55 pseudouridine synthase Pus10